MSIDFSQAYLDGCREAPQTTIAHTDVEETIAMFCKELEGVTSTKLGEQNVQVMSIGRIGVEGIGTRYQRETVEPIDRPLEGGDLLAWQRLVMCRVGGRASPSNGVDLLSFKRSELGFPVTVQWADGRRFEHFDKQSLAANLASMLRDPHCNARIRKAVSDFTGGK